MNLFLFFKDKDFFGKVVESFIKNKMEKSFIDFFLLDDKKEILKFATTERI